METNEEDIYSEIDFGYETKKPSVAKQLLCLPVAILWCIIGYGLLCMEPPKNDDDYYDFEKYAFRKPIRRKIKADKKLAIKLKTMKTSIKKRKSSNNYSKLSSNNQTANTSTIKDKNDGLIDESNFTSKMINHQRRPSIDSAYESNYSTVTENKRLNVEDDERPDSVEKTVVLTNTSNADIIFKRKKEFEIEESKINTKLENCQTFFNDSLNKDETDNISMASSCMTTSELNYGDVIRRLESLRV